MARHDAPSPVHLDDYRPPVYLVDRVDLRFSLYEHLTRVVARMSMRRNGQQDGRDLALNGRDLELVRILKNGRRLEEGAYEVSTEGLLFTNPGENFELEIETIIHPEKNSSLEGLYKTGGNFCTQCEAEGFRKLTYYPDRPDVLARFSTTIEADATNYPVLLSNGNPVESGALENGRHFARWEDPFPKPSYLFALVAGRLACVEDFYLTASGRKVRLQIYVEEHNLDKCEHAMKSLQAAMRWDEQRFGREYDLDIYMIVAVDDFNMGAMENKGLNIFNSKFVLARPETASDQDFIDIESVVGHEYFHNWSGNRVTCRDWFQLTLKEGLTVFRDQEFTADLNSRGLKRIQDVNLLRNRQFAEDAGPMAHAIQPRAYMEINNFYTATVYNKGAEVIRMIYSLLGEQRFRRGMDLYFASHDGEAATTEDFVRAMEDATGLQLKQFRRWYSQAGTPRLSVATHYEPDADCYHVTLCQQRPAVMDAAGWAPLHIPVRLGLIDAEGQDMPLRLEGEERAAGCERVLELKTEKQTFRFAGVKTQPVLSVLRDFSAPVELVYEQPDEELAFLMANDSDAFNRWDAGQRLARAIMLRRLRGAAEQRSVARDLFLGALETMLADSTLDSALVAETIRLPSENELAGNFAEIDVDGIHRVHSEFAREIAVYLHDALHAACERHAGVSPEDEGANAMASRSLYNACLNYLVLAEDEQGRQNALQRLRHSRNMTEQIGALRALVHAGCDEAKLASEEFEKRWIDEPLVMDKWLTVQATAPLPDTVQQVARLLEHTCFDLHNPNRVRSLLGAFGEANPYGFHARDGSGYHLITDQVISLNRLNPSTAARLLSPLTRWRKYDSGRRALMRAELQRIAGLEDLSRNLYELVSRSLADTASKEMT